MSNWEMVKLGTVCKFINGDRGKNYPSGKDIVDNGIPFINAGHLENNTISFDNMNYIKDGKYHQLGSGKIQNGDFLYCLRGSLGKHAIVDNMEYGAVASSLVILRPQNINVNYLSYCMDSPSILEQLRKANNGSSQPNLSATNVKQYEIPFPPLETQRQIAKTLDTTSELLQMRKKQLAELDKLIQSVFYDMFGDPITNEKGWEVKPLQELTTKLGDGLHGTPNYNLGGKYYFINGNNLEEGKIVITESTKRVDETEFNKYQKPLNQNTMLVSINGTLGKVAFYNNENIILGKSACYFNVKFDQIEKKYLYYILKSDYFIQYAIDNSTGSTIKNVSLKSMRELPVLYPPLSIQQKFAEIVIKIEEQKALVEKAIDETQHLFDSLMQEYFE